MFAGIPVTREWGWSGLRVQFPVWCLCPDIRCVIGWGRSQVKGDNACATPDIANTSPIRFSSLFRGLRATKRPTTPVAIGCIALLLSTRVPSSPDTTPVFITTSTQPLLFLFLPPVRVEQPSMNRHWDCIGVFCLDCAHRVWIFFLFFFSFRFVSSSFWIYRCLLRYSIFFWIVEEDILYVECHRLCSMDLLWFGF